MHIRPILSALSRNKASVVLIGLQVALTLAIVCNALFIVSQRLDRMDRPSGMNEADTFTVTSSGFGPGFDPHAVMRSDLLLLRRLPGVRAATAVNTTPLTNSGWSSGILLSPQQRTATAESAFYIVGDSALEAFGVRLVAGRDFLPAEMHDIHFGHRLQPPVVIVTRALAERLFPGEDAIGRQIHLNDEGEPTTIIGVVDALQQPWVDSSSIGYSTFVPAWMPFGNASRYLVRTDPGRRDEVIQAAEAALAAANTDRIVGRVRTLEGLRADAYAGDRSMAIVLGAVVLALLAVTALGIVGLASFWVAQRTRQIGTRRALGATRRDILHHFQAENFLITSLGLLLGAILTYGLSLWLMQNHEVPRLPWFYLPAGFASLWLLGQVAVLGPALRASRVPPAVATRTV